MGRKTRADPISFPGGRWCNDGALSAALSNTTPARASAVKQVRDSYNRLAIYDRFNDVLTTDQAAQFAFIKSNEDWKHYGDRFVAEVEEYKILSFDTENRLSASGSGPVLFVISSTPSGYTLMFDLDRLAGPEPMDHDYPLMYLPTQFRKFIRDDDYVKIGSDICRDLRATGVCFRNTVDTRDLFRHYRRTDTKFSTPIIQISGAGPREGLGIINAWSKGEDTKPYTQEVYKSMYGNHNYVINGRPHWPWWRRVFQLYGWRKTNQGHLDLHHHWYAYHDGTAPFSLIYRVILERFIRYTPIPFMAPPSLSTPIFNRFPHDELESDHVPTLVRDFLVPFVNTITIHEDDVDPMTDLDALEVAPLPAKLPRLQVSIHKAPSLPTEEHPTSTSDDHNKSKKTHKRGGKHPYPTAAWKTSDRASIFWDSDPSFGPACTCCGSKTHNFRADNSYDVICPVYLNNNNKAPLCEYPLCTDRFTHTMRLCKTLHHICQLCHIRGHTEVHNCRQWTAAQWDDNRRQWEDAADEGFFTSLRRTQWLFGYFAHRKFTPFPFPFSTYAEMNALPVPYVSKALEEFATKGTWPARTTRKRPQHHSELRSYHSKPAKRFLT